jgi:hypothetical protein
MLAASAALQASLRTSHVVAIQADIYMPGQAPFSVPVQGGSLMLDRTARVRRTGSIQIPWTDELVRLGVVADARTLPFGSYVKISRGVRYGDGSRELIQIAYLRVASVSWQTHEDTATIELSDRMAQVADEPLLAPYVASGKKPSAAAIELAQAVFGGTITYTSTVNPASEPVLNDVIYKAGDERAEKIADLALAVGAEAFFDELGNFRFEPLPSVGTAAVWTIDAGATGVMISADEALDRTRVFNGALVEGQNAASDPPVSALVVDSDPSSPTLWGGPFGKVARYETTAAVQTVPQAQAAAQALLTNQLGLERQVRITAVPNPLLVPEDTVQLVFPDGSAELHLIEAISVPLDPVSPQELVSRTIWRPPTTFGAFEGSEAYAELAGAEIAA